jgi:hypothetical protein
MTEKRKFLGVHFQCCNIYSRIYINKERSAYAGACPRCHKRVQIKVGPGGSNTRFFTTR